PGQEAAGALLGHAPRRPRLAGAARGGGRGRGGITDGTGRRRGQTGRDHEGRPRGWRASSKLCLSGGLHQGVNQRTPERRGGGAYGEHWEASGSERATTRIVECSPKACLGGPIGAKATRPSRRERASVRKISPRPEATGGSLPPPGPPLASLCSRGQKRAAAGGFSPKSAVDSPVAS